MIEALDDKRLERWLCEPTDDQQSFQKTNDQTNANPNCPLKPKTVEPQRHLGTETTTAQHFSQTPQEEMTLTS